MLTVEFKEYHVKKKSPSKQRRDTMRRKQYFDNRKSAKIQQENGGVVDTPAAQIGVEEKCTPPAMKCTPPVPSSLEGEQGLANPQTFQLRLESPIWESVQDLSAPEGSQAEECITTGPDIGHAEHYSIFS